MTAEQFQHQPVTVPRVVLRNYKSIAACDVALHNLTFLVGPNGAGKSNFVDALRLVADGLRTSLDHALRDRGGIKEVRRRSGGHPTHFEIRLDLRLGSETGHYSFRVGARKSGGFEVQREECALGPHNYVVKAGRVVSSTLTSPPSASADRLYLVNVSGLKEFRPAYDALSTMGFYNLNPAQIRELQPPDAGVLLARDGANIAAVVGQLARNAPPVKARIEEYLAKVVPGIAGVDSRVVGPKETLEFRQRVTGSRDPWRFLAANMSDGTLRALGILVAIFQSMGGISVPLVAIEEPEIALHPAAAGLLRDSLRDASQTTQLLVTSHSPDLLDDASFDPEVFLAVESRDGATTVDRIDAAGRHALRTKLYTPGELLRMNQFTPERSDSAITEVAGSTLFDLE